MTKVLGSSSARRRLAVWIGAGLLAGTSLGCLTPVDVLPPVDDAKRARAARDVGIDHLSKGKLAMAIRQLQLAASLDDTDVETHLWLGESYRRKGRLNEAEGHLQMALDLRPTHHSTRLSLSGLYLQMERYEDAILESQLLIDDPLFGEPWQAYNNLGWAHYKLGEFMEGRAAFTEALDFKPDYWPALLNMGILESESGHTVRAIRFFEELVEMEIGSSPEAEANYRMGEIYVGLGKRDKAITHFDASLANAPHGSWAKGSENYLRMLR